MSLIRCPCLILALVCAPRAFSAPVLHSASSINELKPTDAGESAFVITGVVQTVSPNSSVITLSDRTGYTQLQFPSPPPLTAGDEVIVSGKARVPSEGDPWCAATNYVKIGVKSVDAPLVVRLEEINPDAFNFRAVRTSGTVIDIFDDEISEEYGFLLIKDGVAIIPVAFTRKQLQSPQKLTDATVSLSGIFYRSISGIRKYSGPFIGLYGANAVEVIVPPPSDPFDVPNLERKFHLAPQEISRLGRRKTQGLVVALWDRNKAMLKEKGGRIVNLTLANNVRPPSYGDFVEAVGRPTTDLFRLNLTGVRTRKVSNPSTTEDAPIDVRASQIVASKYCVLRNESVPIRPYHGVLVRMKGIVRTIPSGPEGQQKLLIEDGGHLVPVDISANPSIGDTAPLDGEVEITGRCLLESDNWSPEFPFPQITGFVIVPRQPSDVRILSYPPWWTPARLLVAFGTILAAVIVCAILRSQLANIRAAMRVKARTQLAADLHDAISQYLSGTALQIVTVRKLLPINEQKAMRHLEIAERTLSSCRKELGNCIRDLRDNALDDNDLNKAIRNAVTYHATGTDLRIRFNLSRSSLSDSTAHAAIRIIRELVTNAVRHGQAGTIRIAGTLDEGTLKFSVSDDGIGFDPESRPGITQGHFGLQGINERIEELGGRVKIQSASGQGTKVTVWIKSKC